MSFEYCICAVGTVCGPQILQTNVFQFEGISYLPLPLSDFTNLNQLFEDTIETAQFSLKTETNDSGQFLCLFFNPGITFDLLSTNLNAYLRIARQFFELPLDSENMEHSSEASNEASTSTQKTALSELSIAELYTQLRVEHSKDTIPDTIPTKIECDKLKPILRAYQNNAVRWMLYRETTYMHTDSDFSQIRCPTLANIPFFFNRKTAEISDKNVERLVIPSGGILADEMGLGKTVEMLALILENKKKKRKRTVDEKAENSVENGVSEVTEFKCLCTSMKRKNVIQCSKCRLWQHRKCVGQYVTKRSYQNYICPECWQFELVVESAATLIVSPPSIKMQWQSEILKHVTDPSFKVLVYNGAKQSGWISPEDMADYDVVLTDYSTMRREIHFCAANKRSGTLRNQSRFINPISPLEKVHWWRTCLDEAQMVETPTNLCSKMVKSLPAVHRWAVTGTPIEKSIDNLYGLLYFIGYEPYTDFNIWRELSSSFYIGNSTPLVNVLKKVMWRTCQSIVWEELGIPLKTEQVHNVIMHDVQAFFYAEQHRQCSDAFCAKARKLEQLEMFRMDPHTLLSLMEPLRKLRQDCTVPMIFNRSELSTTKKVLNPKELLQHMINNNENDCKSELRSIASSLNGIAAIHIIREEFDLAEKMYKSVLRWSKDFVGTISVDSLLQMHALYNLLEILEVQGKMDCPDAEEYRKEYERLEWKYLESKSTLVKAVEDRQSVITQSIQDLSKKCIDKQCRWWSDVVYELGDNVLPNRVNDEIRSNYPHSAYSNVSSYREILYIIGMWLDRVSVERKKIQKSFENLKYFSKNVRPKRELNRTDSEMIEHLIRSAFECHLNPLLVAGDGDASEKRQRKKQHNSKKVCQLCHVKRAIKMYECVIFDKIFVEDEMKDNTGNWNPSLQETMLKLILSQARKERCSPEYIHDGEIHLSIIESYKNEFKEYSKLWVEINYALSAYDELNMCKSRLQAIDPIEMEKNPELKKSQLNILSHEIDVKLFEMNEQLQQANVKFMWLQGKSKYLRHLEKKDDVDVCPICQQVPDEKYSVLECGHHLCMICLSIVMAKNKHNLICSICRNKQKYSSIYYATCKPKTNTCDTEQIEFIGDYSKKVEDIVKTVIRLRKADGKIKILIFSQWKPVLDVLAKALKENSIEYRTKSVTFHKCIDEFKDEKLNVTCLLLPLSYGSKGLNLIEATHVMLVEPILNPGEELQAIGRIHRIGQTRPTFVHRFIVQNSIEETIWKTISADKSGKWTKKDVTVEHLKELFKLEHTEDVPL